jgi:hypothetical protein
VLKPHEGTDNFPKAARQFLLKWSFYRLVFIEIPLLQVDNKGFLGKKSCKMRVENVFKWYKLLHLKQELPELVATTYIFKWCLQSQV